MGYICHEIRTPLMVASVGTELLESELQSQFNDNKDHHTLITLKDIRASCDNAMTIVNEMLIFHKFENGMFDIELENISTLSLFESSVKSFKLQVRSLTNTLYFKFD